MQFELRFRPWALVGVALAIGGAFALGFSGIIGDGSSSNSELGVWAMAILLVAVGATLTMLNTKPNEVA